jgi:hypothetical protein
MVALKDKNFTYVLLQTQRNNGVWYWKKHLTERNIAVYLQILFSETTAGP